METMWTDESIMRIMDAEKEKAYYRRYEEMKPRLEAIRVIHEAHKLAEVRYHVKYNRLKDLLNSGLIGPPGQPQRSDRHVWLAGEVRRQLIAELNNESPIREDYEDETNQ